MGQRLRAGGRDRLGNGVDGGCGLGDAGHARGQSVRRLRHGVARGLEPGRDERQPGLIEMLPPRINDGDLRTLQPLDQPVDKRRARSACTDDDDARGRGDARGTRGQADACRDKSAGTQAQKATPGRGKAGRCHIRFLKVHRCAVLLTRKQQ